MSNYVIEVGSQLKYFKKYFPNININFSGLGYNMFIHNTFINRDYYIFKQLILELTNSHRLYEECSNLKMSLDPWDVYDYHDSKVVFDMLLNRRLYMLFNLIKEKIDIYGENKNRYLVNKVEDYIILKFIIYVIDNEYNKYMIGKGNRIIEELFIKLSENPNIILLKDIFIMYDLVYKSRELNKEDKEAINVYCIKLNEFFNNFILHLKEDGAMMNSQIEYI